MLKNKHEQDTCKSFVFIFYCILEPKQVGILESDGDFFGPSGLCFRQQLAAQEGKQDAAVLADGGATTHAAFSPFTASPLTSNSAGGYKS